MVTHKGLINLRGNILLAGGGIICVIVLAIAAIFALYGASTEAGQKSSTGRVSQAKGNQSSLLTSEDVLRIMARVKPDQIDSKLSLRSKSGRILKLTLTIDPVMQDYATKLAADSSALQTSVVAMDPRDGRIIALAENDQLGSRGFLSLNADYPAASIFKVVSAAAALERAGFSPEKTVSFSGNQHTLYKSQLKEKNSRYTTKTSFRKAFASSINPVFGKIGIYYLGHDVLKSYGERFYFNRKIPFDMPMSLSRLDVPADSFGLAEVASGFNKDTVMSPLHAALLAASAANDGVMVRPRIVDSVMSDEGKIVYRGKGGIISRVISSETAAALRVLMKETVTKGTCKKSFSKLVRSKSAKNVTLGAKTGSIHDRLGRFKLDWTTAFALPPDSRNPITVAVLNVHGEKMGVKANEIASMMIKRWLR